MIPAARACQSKAITLWVQRPARSARAAGGSACYVKGLAEPDLFFRLRDHVVDRGRDLAVRQVNPAALRRHDALLALEALERVLMQRVDALRDTRRPRRDV